MKRSVICLAVFFLCAVLYGCGDADIDAIGDPSLSGSVSIDGGDEVNKQPTILPGPDHQGGVPTDETTDDGVAGGTDILPPTTPEPLGLAPKQKTPN